VRLANRLILALVAVVAAVAIVTSYTVLKFEQRNLLRMITMGADQLSRSITSSTWHAMLADRRDDVYQTMEMIAAKQGIDHIRMFNRDGNMTFSSVAAERGTHLTGPAGSCEGCHQRGLKLESLRLEDRVRLTTAASGQRRLSIITPIPNEPSCSSAACHAHPPAERVIGVLEVSLKLDEMDVELAGMQNRILVRMGAEMLILGAMIYLLTTRFVRRPIEQLIRSTHAISNMDLEAPITVARGSGEVAELARSFDNMRVRLREAIGEINQFAQKLETKVGERTRELQLAHQKLMQSDRLASLGQLSASVAHEINNPIGGILNLSMLLQRLLKEDGVPPERLDDFRRYLGQISSETSRVGRIVSDLLAFSRRSAPHRAEADLNAIIKSTLSLVQHKLKLSSVEVRRDLDPELPPVLCDRSQIQQVVLNLLLNAAEAMQNRPNPVLEIATGWKKPDAVWFRIADTGEGMPPEVMKKIFDPFFTTKPEGKGVGLGLAVSYGIVQSHAGEIDVTSEPGVGTAFTITLPLATPPPQTDPAEVARA
jgi:two-component system NtrC family sensor kinase